MKPPLLFALYFAFSVQVGQTDKLFAVQYNSDLSGFSVNGNYLVVYGQSGSKYGVWDQARGIWSLGPQSASPWAPINLGSKMLFTRSQSASIDAFDVDADAWSTLRFPAMPQDTVQGAVLGSRAYFYGFSSGVVGPNSSQTVQAMELDPSSATAVWTNLTDPSPIPRTGSAVAAVGGELLIAGGWQQPGDTADVYDTGSGQWMSHRMLQSYYPAYAFSAGGKILLATVPITTALGADLYDSSTRSWKFVYFPDGFSSSARKFPVSLGSVMAFVYVNGSAHVYNPGSGAWTLGNVDPQGLLDCTTDAACPFFQARADSGNLYLVYQTDTGKRAVYVHAIPQPLTPAFDWTSVIKGLGGGAITGIVLAVVALIGAIIAGVVCIVRCQRRRRARSRFSRFRRRRFFDEDEDSLLGHDFDDDRD
eukprot:TRINITY_DN3442_c0_g1_i1.p1 TRINITY_DN3442_c0_g1~~TRINITY_DN3442_c0_g1_i1.p1  ORF type:complete len:420 (-),score=100.88 TRINITY_DN3442_c0_g1_i1:54-1313(-)